LQASESSYSGSPRALLHTKFGDLDVQTSSNKGTPEWVVVYKRPWPKIPLLRIHSSCLFSEAFATTDCDCSLQLHAALKVVAEEGGAVVYLYQEGRGQGIFRKIQALAVEQEQQVDTAEAFTRLGFHLDPREYSKAGEALKAIGFPLTVRLATNNPRKVTALSEIGYTVEARVQLKLTLTLRIRKYLRSKVLGLNHYESD
jgi:3,4-dihydroxy 2-butanone 4-phosphate synthase / GTP cyclohydrolase II